jgi:hypothetical protein
MITLLSINSTILVRLDKCSVSESLQVCDHFDKIFLDASSAIKTNSAHKSIRRAIVVTTILVLIVEFKLSRAN